MHHTSRTILSVLLILQVLACSDGNNETVEKKITEKVIDKVDTKPAAYYARLHKKIAYGAATLAEARQALTQNDVGALTNTIHALYSLRWNRGVQNLLTDIWSLDEKKYPELAWVELSKTPTRIAIASTINRIQITNTDEYKEFIRAHKDDEHEFHRAQVVIALGFNGDPDDIEYLVSMADGDNKYVTQTAITGLALMESDEARDALGQLWKRHQGDPRQILIEDVLQKVYSVTPSEKKPE